MCPGSAALRSLHLLGSARVRRTAAAAMGAHWRYVSFAAGLALTLVSGSLYAFSVYGPRLKSDLGLTQTETNVIVSMSNVGLYLVPHLGVLMVSHCSGPRAQRVWLIGAIEIF